MGCSIGQAGITKGDTSLTELDLDLKCIYQFDVVLGDRHL